VCGIAGYIQRASSPERPIERMTALLAHRGPDGQGIWEHRFGDWTIALGHRRLSIIDIAGGHQPLCNEDGTVWITYNGEIYNFAALREKLERGGHHFATRCDTETIVHQVEQHAEAGLDHLEGMFAFAVWDQTAGRLLLARDRIGIKPLYYAPLPDGGIAFASELTSLLAHPAVDRAISRDGIASLFFLDYIHPPHTIVRGARKLEPAHFLVWDAARTGETPASKPFWRLQCARDDDEGEHEPLAPDNLAVRLREKLERSVQAQLIADVPLGVFLSGGIDSSMVAALARRHVGGRLKTFSIAFTDPAFDESAFARRMSRHLETEHFERTLAEEELVATVDRALDCLDEPVGDPSIVPTYLLSELAAGHVKVALGGDGGDELWGGYPTYKAHRYARLYECLPQTARSGFTEPLVRRLPVRHGYQNLEWKLKRFVLRWDNHPLRRHLRWMSNTDLPELRQLLKTDRAWPLPEVIRDLTSPDGLTPDDLNAVLAIDLWSYLPGAVLTKVDRASMAHGLEVRPPMLGNELVNFAFSLSARQKMIGSLPKALLKRAAEDLLPPEVVHRPKRGFAIPLARWLNGPLKPKLDAAINDLQQISSQPILDPEVIERWRREHASRAVDRSKPLWAIVVLHHWARRLAVNFVS
jgi:asparagine synthase (glutamine-hydrolysing)